QQENAVALALQKRVGGDGRSHLDLADRAGRNAVAGLQPEQVADALYGGVAIGFGVFGKQLAGMKAALRVAADNIGECAAAIDPEIPVSRRHKLAPKPGLILSRSVVQSRTTIIRQHFVDKM